jgi:organic hydroperoxide reductase OsmC/OhrA
VSRHTATIAWQRDGAAFTDNRYSRRHVWSFDGGLEVPASAAPDVVRPPLSDPTAIDPEEAFVAALASCHMLWFLSLAARAGYAIDSYRDEAVGEMGKNAEGKTAITVVTLRPAVRFAGERRPSEDELRALHDDAHERCFIASSVRSDVRCEPVAG